MKISEVMSRGVECTRPDATLREAAERMKTLDVGALPVCDNDRLAGLLTDRDIVIRSIASGRDPQKEKVRDVMTPEIVFCFEDQDVGEAARLMKDKQIRRLPILNRDKRLVGIVSLGDVAVETGDKHLAGEALHGISQAPATRR